MNPLQFGIYPGGIAGSDQGLTNSKPDDYSKVHQALDLLQGKQTQFLVRLYTQYVGAGRIEENNLEAFINKKRKVDLVLQYQSDTYNKHDWIASIQLMIDKYSDYLHSIQITEEANLYHVPVIDGSKPHVREALVAGIIAAKRHIMENELNITVGFSAVPNFNEEDDFWASIYNIGGDSFINSIDYVGLDFFPDVFRPVAADGQPGDLIASVHFVLDKFRNSSLQSANIPLSVPLHIAENGWPTGTQRTYEKQAYVLETIIRTVFENRAKYNITHYSLFSLRDSDSNVDDIFYQFGILKDDYSAKPAFHKYAQLVNELTI